MAITPNKKKDPFKGSFLQIATKIGKFLEIKNKEYNNSKDKAGEILKMLWGRGVGLPEMWDFSLVTRILDKIIRLPYASPEQKKKAYVDLAGYAIIGIEHYEDVQDIEDTELDDFENKKLAFIREKIV